MANSISPEDLDKKRQEIAKLREKIAAEESTQAEAVSAQAREIEAARLDAEAARLEAELAAAKEASKRTVVKEGAAGPLAQAREQLQFSQQQAVTSVPVDTNAGNKSGDEN